jgi:hypothetical protein
LHLLAEALKCVRGRRYAIPNCFEGDDAELQVFRFINLTHTASADNPNDAKTAKNEFAWLEADALDIQKPIEMAQGCVKRSSVLLFSLKKLFKVLL